MILEWSNQGSNARGRGLGTDSTGRILFSNVLRATTKVTHPSIF